MICIRSTIVCARNSVSSKTELSGQNVTVVPVRGSPVARSFGAGPVALIFLVLWAVDSALALAHTDYENAVLWLRSPWNAILASLLIAVASFHMNIGMRVIIEDYIHKPPTKAALLILNLFVAVLVTAAGVFSILKVALSGGAY